MLSASSMLGTVRQQHAKGTLSEDKSGPYELAKPTERPIFFTLMRLNPKPTIFEVSAGGISAWATQGDHKTPYEKRLLQHDTIPLIRLLRVLPGRHSDSIRCETVYAEIHEAPSYKAISYCWGTTSSPVPINIDKQPRRIGLNLASALQSFRDQDTAVLLWADALCINQDDPQEKNYQISLMSQIYKNAATVNVWLGLDTADRKCSQAFELLETLQRVRQSDNGSYDLIGSMLDGTCQQFGLPRLSDPHWSCLRDLLTHPWFGRLWIVQEVALSTHAVLHCGSASLDWETFRAGFLYLTANVFWYRPDYLPDIPAYVRTVQLVTTCSRVKSSRPVSNLLSLLDSHRSTQAHDPRDKVYGLLGLIPAMTSGNNSIVPDYDRKVEDVYLETAQAIIEQSTTLDVLGIPKTGQEVTARALPSWVPDWSAPNLADSLTFRTANDEPFFAFDAAKTTTYPKYAIVDGPTLILKGQLLDCVAETGMVLDPFVGQNSSGDVRLRICTFMVHKSQVFDSWRRIANRRKHTVYRLTGKAFAEEYEETLLLGRPSYAEYARKVAKEHTKWSSVLGRGWNHLLLRTGIALPVANFVDARSWYIYMANTAYAGEDDAAATILRCAWRRFFWTEKGYIGLGPQGMVPSDQIFLVQGSRVPLVFRSHGANWRLVGDCYLHGIMNGEAFDQSRLEQMCVV